MAEDTFSVTRAKYRWCCNPMCGSAEGLEVHHIAPRSRGGEDDEENLVLLCSRCHRRRHEGRLEVAALGGGQVRFTDLETGEAAVFRRVPHLAQGPDSIFAEAQTVEQWLEVSSFAERIRPLSSEELVELHSILKGLYRCTRMHPGIIAHQLQEPLVMLGFSDRDWWSPLCPRRHRFLLENSVLLRVGEGTSVEP
jgi:hypothetical protein